jgi:Phage integrase family
LTLNGKSAERRILLANFECSLVICAIVPSIHCFDTVPSLNSNALWWRSCTSDCNHRFRANSSDPSYGQEATAGRFDGGLGLWGELSTAPIDTREEKADNSPVVSKRSQNIVKNWRGGRSPPTTVNSSVRTRVYLTTAEIERLMAAARKSSRYGHRDATMILIGYRHGLRASELCDLRWSQVELATGRLHVRRAKNGSPSVHPVQGDEIRALRRLHREQGHDTRALQAWLGHKNIQHTVRSTELAPDRFKNFWR